MTDVQPRSSLSWRPVDDAPDLLGPTVSQLLGTWSSSLVEVAPIDPALADTAEFCRNYGVEPACSANCVVITGKREGVVRYAACVILATTRADINGVARRLLDVRKASFAPMSDAVRLTGMEYGGITPIGLPADWPILVASQVADAGPVVVGSGRRASKIRIDGAALLELPNAQLAEELAG
ncbi:YbaK/EbsC family protein [Jatrophihabitans telluris]|uniref:YbaK/EbsC family protein n=1 Tax=Jatrophihabitans telluris TaxID=2038343 RepID=A0ABY4R1U3_9ACTN|nr:YbaK/EbsC family protein [Jatrophihabitans telluris]UQX89795.1 YbaK/EbsC family protein [Jatrophihabitans telluris]